MNTTKWLNIFALGLASIAVGLVAFKNLEGDKNGQLLNVSYDPTREVYKEINSKFIVKYEAEVGHRVEHRAIPRRLVASGPSGCGGVGGRCRNARTSIGYRSGCPNVG